MKKIFALLLEKENKKLGMSFLLFLLFILISVISLLRGVIFQETTRILVSAMGLLVCAGLAFLIAKTVIDRSKKAAVVPPLKTRNKKVKA